jgi:hypothetical protein
MANNQNPANASRAISRSDMSGHVQVPVVVGAWSARVDAGVAELVAALWRRRIKTLYSCEDVSPWEGRWRVDPHEPRIGMTFATADDLLRLLRRLPWGSALYESALGPEPRWDYDFVFSRWLSREVRAMGMALQPGLRLQVHTAIPRSDTGGLLRLLNTRLP